MNFGKYHFAPHQIDKDKKEANVLVVNGGGSHGIIPLYALSALEKITGKPAVEHFDLFAGVSAGSIISTALNVPNADGTARHSVNSLIDQYLALISKLFHASFLDNIKSGGGLWGPVFSGKKKLNELRILLGDTPIRDLIKETMILSTDLRNAAPLLVSKHFSTVADSWNSPAYQIVGGSSATPVFFPSEIVQVPGTETYLDLVDGGCVQNDPILVSTLAAKYFFPNAKLKIVNLGTGKNHPLKQTKKPYKGGVFQWVFTTKMINLMMYSKENLSVDLFSHPMNKKFLKASVLYLNPTLPKGFPSSFSGTSQEKKEMVSFSKKFAETVGEDSFTEIG